MSTEITQENVLPVYFFHDGKKYPEFPPYMIMQYADEGTLEDLLNKRRAERQNFAPEELRQLLLGLAKGLQAINQKVVHRDIKPDNILFVKGTPKISDFGLSKIVGATTRTLTFKGINHIRYCAPEAWQQEKNTPAMDMYSMGIVFYEVATLHHPYNVKTSGNQIEAWKNAHFSQLPDDPRNHNSSLDFGLSQVILKMLAKRPENRYGSWGEVVERLTSSENLAVPKRDVSSLLDHSFKSHQKAEEARLKAQEEKRKHDENEARIKYCFNEIVGDAQETVEAFNRQSDFGKLQLAKVSDLSFSIQVKQDYTPSFQGTYRPFIHAEVSILNSESQKFRNQLIKSWGLVKCPSGQGFNLLLVQKDNEDLYGEWITLHVRDSAFSQRRTHGREPFPFQLHQLSDEIKLIGAIHIYQTEVMLFRPEMFDPLIKEILEYQ